MGRVKTFSNGGSLLPGDLNSIEDDYEYAFATYKTLGPSERSARHSAASLAGTFPFAGPAASVAGLGVVGTGLQSNIAFYLDPADFLANTRTSKVRLRLHVVTNGVAPAANYTAGLYNVTGWAGGSGSNPFINSVAAVVAGSTAAINTPGVNSATRVDSTDFSFPAAGWYILQYVVSANPAANSVTELRAELQVRQV